MFSNFVEFCQPGSQFFKFVNLLVPNLLSFDVLGLKIGQLLSQVSKPVRRLLHLFENVWFALLNDIVELLFAFKLVNFQLPLELFLLLDLFFGRLQITFQIEKEVWLLH